MKKSSDGASIVVTADIKNTSDAPIWVADRLIEPGAGDKFKRTDRLTVMNTDDPKVVRFVAGAVSSDSPSTSIYEPTFSELAAGTSVTRTWTVPSPLKDWNPVGGTDDLSKDAKQAVLQIHTSIVAPSSMTKVPTSDAKPIEIPEWPRAMQIVTGPPLPLL